MMENSLGLPLAVLEAPMVSQFDKVKDVEGKISQNETEDILFNEIKSLLSSSFSVPKSSPRVSNLAGKVETIIIEEVSEGVGYVKKKKCIWARLEKVSMVVGHDVNIEDIPNILGKYLVGCFRGKVVHVESLK